MGEPGTTAACDTENLVEIPGCTGDCSCATADPEGLLGGFPAKSSSTCALSGYATKRIEEPETDWVAPSEPGECSIRGYADLHNHLFGHLAHGGNTFAGKSAPVDGQGEFALDRSDDPYDWTNPPPTIMSALSSLDDLAIHQSHDFLSGDPVGSGTKDGANGSTGAPYFNNWPTWTTTTHQQMYFKWVERAFRGGMRLTTMFSVTNEALCRTTKGVDCANSMGPIDDQIAAAYDFQDFIDEQCRQDIITGQDSGFCIGEDGAEEGWFRIVTEPLQARQIISEGKLAVVLGIEVDNLFNCKEENSNRPSADCPNMRDENGNLILNDLGEPIDTVEKAVNHYYAKGVRHFFPIHNFDNAFGGAATWNDIIALGNAYSEQRWWDIEDCAAEGYGSFLSGGAFDEFFKLLIGEIGFGGELPPRPLYEGVACNRFGLNLDTSTPGPDKRGLGSELLLAVMQRGMIIDIDHMSRKSLDHTLELTRNFAGRPNDPQYQYPLVASHVQFFDLHKRRYAPLSTLGRHERMRTREQLEAIRDGGGMIAAMTKDDVQDTDLKDTIVTLPYSEPLFGAAIKNDCSQSTKTFTQAYQYAVDLMAGPVALGSDFNGIAGHVGPRFGDDACGSDLPLSASINQARNRSAQLRAGNRLEYPFTLEEFGTFDRQETGFKTFDFNVDGLAHVGLLPDMIKDMQNIGLEQPYTDALFGSAEEYIRVWEKAVKVAAITNGDPIPDAPPAELTCPRPSLCVGDGDTPPGITCPAALTLECTGVETVAAFPAPEAIDGSCGAATLQGCIPGSGSDFLVGDTSISCAVIDSARNVESCGFNVTVVDTQQPQITSMPADLTGIECTSPQGASPALGQAAAADVCDAAPVISNDATPTIPIGANTVTWSATDASGNSDTAPQLVEVVDTVPPQISCPAAIVRECTGNQSATVTPDAASGSDLCSTTVAFSRPDTQAFGLGLSELSYTATDAQGLFTSCTSTVEIQDTTPPEISAVVPSTEVLWPPNHELMDVVVSVTVNDLCDNALPVCSVTGISSNEHLNTAGDGNTDLDWAWNPDQTGSALNVLLRAEREGSGDGRIYAVEVTCADEAGNTTIAQTTVNAPKNNN
ncbi:HYR domain-containing protein [Marinobacter caseinilyticus]|uniref:HYR domain-containing protein n=1 Tax=Marinobacter caseinilyticus TaxID=2692195 RepID=UPI00140A13F7|nr:HYR domain-containing protein [Marinobacter caseinilyticus]